MFSSFKKLTGTALALVLFSAPSFAATVTPEGAATLKTLIQAQIDLFKNTEAASGSQYITEGDLKVEPADGYYAVTFPHSKLKDSAGTVIDIGMLAANVIPGDKPQEWKAAIAIPTPLRLIGSDNLPIGQIDLGTQHALGVWDMDISSFVRLDAKYENISFTKSQSPSTVRVATLGVETRLDRAANNNLSGPASIVASNLTFASPEDQLTGAIQELRLDATIKDFDPKVGKQVNEQLNAMGQRGQSIIGKDGSFQNGPLMFDVMANLLGKSSEAISSNVGLTGLTITGPGDNTVPGTPETPAMETFTLGQAALGIDLSGLRSGMAKAGLKVTYSGLKPANATNPFMDILPTSLDLGLIAENVPFQKLTDLGRTALAPGETGGAEAAATTAPKLLTEAGTTLSHSFDFAANLWKGKGSGVLRANTAALLGYTADQDVELEGLDKVIEKINEEIKKPNNPMAPSLQSALGPLTILQMVGQKKDGNPDTRTYKLVMDEKGKTLLNGSDMSTLLGGIARTPDAAAPASGSEEPAEEAPASPAQ